jgi:gluconolactonase
VDGVLKSKVLTTGLAFPEGPVALPDGSLLVVEIAGGRLTRVAADGTQTVVAETGGGPTGAAIGPDGAAYICNNGGLDWSYDEARGWHNSGPLQSNSGGSIQRVDLVTGEVEDLFVASDALPLAFPNDIVFDREGGYWFTDLGHNRPGRRIRDIGAVYYVAPGGSISQAIYPIVAPNGIGLSRDERTLYVAETEGARVWAFDLDAPGQVRPTTQPSPNGGRLLAASGDHVYKRFDSLAVDADGNVIVGTLVQGGLTVVPPEGGAARHIDLPDPMTANVCFGGEDLRTAYVTQSATGGIITFPWERGGLRLNFYDKAPIGQGRLA